MNKIEIIGGNYRGHWEKTCTSCRGIIIQNDQNQLSSMSRGSLTGRQPVLF